MKNPKKENTRFHKINTEEIKMQGKNLVKICMFLWLLGFVW